MRILFLGDIVGKVGRETVKKVLPELRKKHQVDFVFANGENLAGGRGVTAATIDEMLACGIDYFTSGNHVFFREGFAEILGDESMRILRPANYPEDVPGRGFVNLDKLLLINLIGTTWMEGPAACPFRTVDEILNHLPLTTYQIPVIVDFHAEATSERQAMGFYLDGRVSAVIGTHTHVPSADAKILSNGTGFVTDVGMVGALNSVLGVIPEKIIEKQKFPYPVRFEWVKKGPAVFNSVLLSLDAQGKTNDIKRLDFQID
ncbi:MAG: YmdB family metallophosphoesterase [Candidatus Cloacimonetes bacterium]|nr:YmdB family metallophosphoesterase [Candidatus Cloacimonadota bacterium]